MTSKLDLTPSLSPPLIRGSLTKTISAVLCLRGSLGSLRIKKSILLPAILRPILRINFMNFRRPKSWTTSPYLSLPPFRGSLLVLLIPMMILIVTWINLRPNRGAHLQVQAKLLRQVMSVLLRLLKILRHPSPMSHLS